MEKFVITVTRETFLRSATLNGKTLHEIEQTETESPSPDIFFLDTINLQKNPENLIRISQTKNEPSN